MSPSLAPQEKLTHNEKPYMELKRELPCFRVFFLVLIERLSLREKPHSYIVIKNIGYICVSEWFMTAKKGCKKISQHVAVLGELGPSHRDYSLGQISIGQTSSHIIQPR